MNMPPLNPHRLLAAARRSMLLGVLSLMVGIAGAYLFDRYLELGVIVASHALAVLGPTTLKIG